MHEWLNRWASGLRFPALAALIAGLFLLDLAIPDLIPFVDEALLGQHDLLSCQGFAGMLQKILLKEVHFYKRVDTVFFLIPELIEV